MDILSVVRMREWRRCSWNCSVKSDKEMIIPCERSCACEGKWLWKWLKTTQHGISPSWVTYELTKLFFFFCCKLRLSELFATDYSPWLPCGVFILCLWRVFLAVVTNLCVFWWLAFVVPPWVNLCPLICLLNPNEKHRRHTKIEFCLPKLSTFTGLCASVSVYFDGLCAYTFWCYLWLISVRETVKCGSPVPHRLQICLPPLLAPSWIVLSQCQQTFS